MILGVCGKIASGKTEVMKVLEKQGFKCVYADEIVKDLYESGGDGAKVVGKVFGSEFLSDDGGVNRVKLREIVFSDRSELERLNKAIHPLVVGAIGDLEGNVAIEAVYLDQVNVDKILWVERPEKDILRCLVEERGFNEELARNAIGLVRRPEKVDFLVENYGSLEDLGHKVSNIVKSSHGI